MASLNKVMIIGRLGKDPEMVYTPGGMAVCKMSVATSETWTDKQTGEKKERVEWHRISVFGKVGENCGRFLVKGSEAYFEGKNQTSSYEKDGITRYSTEIVAHTVQFLGGKQQGQQNSGYQQPQNQGYQNQGGYQQQEQFGAGMNQQQIDDDIPF